MGGNTSGARLGWFRRKIKASLKPAHTKQTKETKE